MHGSHKIVHTASIQYHNVYAAIYLQATQRDSKAATAQPEQRRNARSKMANGKRIVIKASDVAACIGENRFKPSHEVLEGLWQRYQKETFTLVTKDEVTQAALTNPEAGRVFKAVKDAITKDSTETQKVFEEAAAKLQLIATLSATEKEVVLEAIRKTAYTTHGLRQEDATALKVSSEEGVRLAKDDSFYTQHVCSAAGYEVVVVGKVDRIEQCPDGSRVLVEIKNRTKRLYRQLYPTERIQLQVYLQMLDLEKGKLVEQYNDQVNTIEVARDREYWKTFIHPRLVEFSTTLINILTDPVARESYITAAITEDTCCIPIPTKKTTTQMDGQSGLML